MRFEQTRELAKFRLELRAFLDDHWPAGLRRYAMNDSVSRELLGAETTVPGLTPDVVRAFFRALGDHGYLATGFPREYGGSGGGPIERYALQLEIAAAGAPFPTTAIGNVAPTLVWLRDERLISRFLPDMLAGKVEYALGYTEPDAGTDLAALSTRAIRDGDHYVLRGQKIFSSNAHFADYYWLAARTDPTASRHRGISLFIVPMDAPGITVQPLITMSGVRTNIVFLDDVRVSADNLVGDENSGWRYLTYALAHERYTAILPSPVVEAFTASVDQLAADGALTPSARVELAKLKADLRAAVLLGWSIASDADRGEEIVAQAAAGKVLVSELRHRLSRFALEALGPAGLLTEADGDAPCEGQLERMYLHAAILTFAAGANDVQRDLMARVGLGLPRSGDVRSSR